MRAGTELRLHDAPERCSDVPAALWAPPMTVAAATATTASASRDRVRTHWVLIRPSFVDWQPPLTLGGRRRGRITEIRELRRELSTRTHAELLEHVPQVRLDRVRREEELGCNLAVRMSLGHQPRDDQLLRRQVRAGTVFTTARALPGRGELGRCAACPGRCTELLEDRQCFVQTSACFEPLLLTPE